MREHAGLRGNAVLLYHRVEHFKQAHDLGNIVTRRVDAYRRVARAVHQAVKHAGSNAGRGVGRVVGLQPRRQAPAQTYGVAKARGDLAFARDLDQVLVAHQLGDRGHHFGREAGRERRQRGAVDRIRQQPVAQAAHVHSGHGRKRGRVVAVDDQPRDFIGLVGNQRFLQELRQRHLRQRHLRRDALLGRLRGDARELIARALGRSAREQLREAVEDITAHAYGLVVNGHLNFGLSAVGPILALLRASATPALPPGSRRLCCNSTSTDETGVSHCRPGCPAQP